MKPLFFGILTLAGLGLARFPEMALSAACATPSFAQAFGASKAVFVGRAADQRAVESASVGIETETTFYVKQLWKGPPEHGQIQLRTCGGVIGDRAVTCGEAFRFHVGEEYVVFASGQPLTTNVCQPTRSTSEAQKVLNWLSGKPRK